MCGAGAAFDVIVSAALLAVVGLIVGWLVVVVVLVCCADVRARVCVRAYVRARVHAFGLVWVPCVACVRACVRASVGVWMCACLHGAVWYVFARACLRSKCGVRIRVRACVCASRVVAPAFCAAFLFFVSFLARYHCFARSASRVRNTCTCMCVWGQYGLRDTAKNCSASGTHFHVISQASAVPQRGPAKFRCRTALPLLRHVSCRGCVRCGSCVCRTVLT